MRRGFTMIELIFVIVIIAILALVAIPRLNATRDDAKVSKSISNLATCIRDAGSSYTASGKINLETPACKSVASDDCFKVTSATLTDGNITIKNGTISDGWCVEARTLANKQDMNGTKSFGGAKIVR